MKRFIVMFVSMFVKYWHVPTATLLMATQPLLTEASLNADGEYEFLMITITLSSEVLKLIVSFCFYCTLPSADYTHFVMGLRNVLEFSIPAAVYFLNNNLVFFILANITSTEFQILSCLKTVFTAILFRCLLSRFLSLQKWMAILTLSCGAAVSQLSQANIVSEPSSGTNTELMDTVSMGAVATIASCLLSSFAGVYSEILLKREGQVHSIHLQNVILYMWGVVFNAIAVVVLYRDELFSTSFFKGYGTLTWLLVVNNALSGLAISAVLKFADNIIRVFAHAGAMTITAVIGSAAFGHRVTAQLIVSIIIVSASTVSYAADGPTISTKPEASNTLLTSTNLVQEVEMATVEESVSCGRAAGV